MWTKSPPVALTFLNPLIMQNTGKSCANKVAAADNQRRGV